MDGGRDHWRARRVRTMCGRRKEEQFSCHVDGRSQPPWPVVAVQERGDSNRLSGHYRTLADVLERLAGAIPAGGVARIGLADELIRLARELAGLDDGATGPSRSLLLDLAADLLEMADELSLAGDHFSALVVEGVEGRVLEALFGAGDRAAPPPPLRR